MTSVASSTGRTGVTIAFTFPLGRYHATATGSAANDGLVEWPPSPWRVLRALYSAWKTRCDDLSELVVTSLLNSLADPPHYSIDPRTAGGHTRHYMPGETSGNPIRFLALDTFVTCRTDTPVLHATWPDAMLSDTQLDALDRLCRSLTWLGRAESLVDAHVVSADEDIPPANSHVVPVDAVDSGEAPIRLLVPTTPLDLDALTVRPSDLRADSKTSVTIPPGATLRTFVRPRPERADMNRASRVPSVRPTAVRFAIVPTLIGRSATRLPTADAVVHTSALRQAVMSRYGGADKSSSTTLSGRGVDGPLRGHQHAHYLALPGDGVRTPVDRVAALVIWAPAGFDEQELAALRSVREVRAFGWLSASREFRVIAEGAGNPASLAPDFAGRSRVWRTVTPVVAGRHPKGTKSWEQEVRSEILSACVDRSLPEPLVELRPWSGRFTTARPRRGRTSHRAHPHRFDVTLTFPVEVDSERFVCIGALSHFGLGLFRPQRAT